MFFLCCHLNTVSSTGTLLQGVTRVETHQIKRKCKVFQSQLSLVIKYVNRGSIQSRSGQITSQGWATWKMGVIDCSEKHSQTHERNARPCAVNVMSFCMQPDAQSAHICGSKTAGVKTPKHELHDCLDFSVMRYDDRWSLRGLTGRLTSTVGSSSVGFSLQ